MRRNRIEPHRPIDAETNFEIRDDFEPFNQRNDVSSRANWDETMRSDKAAEFWSDYVMPNARARKADGYTQRDYALRNAAWHFTKAFATLRSASHGRYEGFNDTFSLHGPGWPEKWPIEDRAAMSERHQAHGALVRRRPRRRLRMGRPLDIQRKVQSHRASRPLPEGLTHVIVVGTEMDHDLTATVPSALAATATGMGYTKDAVTLMCVAQYIRNLGYEAHASMNDTSLNIPLAIQAGLGEYGRNGLLITREFGPRIRIGKIFTNLPMRPDAPRRHSVTQFCAICNACAAGCPPRAIPVGQPEFAAPNISSFATVKKWTVDGEKCFKFWTQQNTECSICIRVCPYNRSTRRMRERLWFWLSGTRLRHLALWLDRLTRSSTRKPAKSWWRGSRAK